MTDPFVSEFIELQHPPIIVEQQELQMQLQAPPIIVEV
jgi:hypothetical protein